MRILVLGATGYLGSHIARHFKASGYQVSGLSRTSEGDLALEADGIVPLRGDLNRLGTVVDLMGQHDATVYAAQLILQQELDTIAALLKTMDGRNHHFLFTSGTGLLSQRTNGLWSEDSFAEDEPFQPSKYIGLRLETETLVRNAGSSGSVRTMVIRPPMIWGHGGCGHLRMFYSDAGRTGEVGYLGRGLNLYSNVHVDDLAEVYRLALEKGTAGALYHAVAGELNNRTLAEAVARDLGVTARSIDFFEGVRRWGKFETLIGMATCSRSRSPRTRRELGWTPRNLDLLTDIGHPAYRALVGR
ncbi:NAD-dependent epimerase/dehydratase family protein [Sphingobium vermicomposti]|uniref:Nucleoside-diphosphate-sugar epimerase n=1 Tax=Sphingobium vermicomposti TaxID=529005 RepID=A0A846M911_9SPHN|nr:NAD-dependent epimerase/dehydratase family protein [Sphingobium vermicomposti]NIJ17933.1 nucleoside-diphosphate-sugar epimerase [Sphingobium vermicomposti]